MRTQMDKKNRRILEIQFADRILKLATAADLSDIAVDEGEEVLGMWCTAFEEHHAYYSLEAPLRN